MQDVKDSVRQVGSPHPCTGAALQAHEACRHHGLQIPKTKPNFSKKMCLRR